MAMQLLFDVLLLPGFVQIWSATPKIGIHKFLPLHIFVAGVQLYIFTLSHLAINSPEDMSCPLTSARCQQERHAKGFKPPGFFFFFTLARLFGDCLLYLFIFNFLWTVQLHYTIKIGKIFEKILDNLSPWLSWQHILECQLLWVFKNVGLKYLMLFCSILKIENFKISIY